MNRRVQLLDCTLRDGGLGLEDAYKNGLSRIRFSERDRTMITDKLIDAHVDIIELGSIEITEDDRRGFAIYPNIESISKVIPINKNQNTLFAALFRGPDTPIEDIPKWKPGFCEAIRVIIRYSELQKSLNFCTALSQKGYKVFVQPMLTMRYTEEELQLLIAESNAMKAYALYFVDSYGYMQNEDVVRFFKRFDEGLDKNIRIGFHAHNNMNLAFSNVLSFLKIETERNIIIDSCLLGMGQGAGNLQTELITDYINGSDRVNYKYHEILEGCEVVEKYSEQALWGYSVTRLLPAIHKTAYKYSIVLRNKYGMEYADIDKVLFAIPEHLRHRYTPENTVELLKTLGLYEKYWEKI